MSMGSQCLLRVRALLGPSLLACLLAGMQGFALDPHRALSQYSHHAWRNEDGLPQNTILAIQQTRDGYLWLGTFEGLVRFDGANFTVYDRHNTPELSEHGIRALLDDGAGGLWVGTKKGVLHYEKGRFQRLPDEGDLRQVSVPALALEGSTLWLGTSLGLEQVPLAGGTRRRYTVKDGLPSAVIEALAVDGTGVLWIGTREGLVRLSAGKLEPVSLPAGADPRVRSLLAARDGALWVGTYSGLMTLRDGKFVWYGPEQGLPRYEVGALWEDRDGGLWVGQETGLARHTAGRFDFLGPKEGLSGTRVYSLFEDRDQNLWVGTADGGLNRLRAGPFLSFGVPEGLAHDFVRTVLETRDGTLWLGTLGGGLHRMKDGRITRLGAAEGLTDDNIRSLAEAPDGTLWVGTHRGAFRYDGKRFTPVLRENGRPLALVWALLLDSRGDVWFGTSSGLVHLHEGRFTVYTPEQGPVPDSVNCMLEDATGTLWFGTHSGVVRYANGTFTQVTDPTLANETIMVFYSDAPGTLWVGTYAGLVRLKDGKGARITLAQGLPDDSVFNLLPDAKGYFWMSSNKGIWRVSRRELEEVADGRRERVRANSYDERDGLRTVETHGGSQPAGWRARDGRLWFTTLRGAVVVDPKNARLERRPPEVVIQEVRVNGQTVPLASRLELAPGKQDLDIRFTVFAPQAPQRLPLRYRLERFDEDWVNSEGRRSASYTRLPPGHYRFHVMVADREGVWREPGAVLEVTLQPWFHQTVWFYLLCALGVGGVAVVSYGWRVGRLKQRERWLQTRVEERTKELARANQELDTHLRTLRATQAQLVQAGKMAAVGTLAAGVGHEINNPLSYIVSNLEYASEEAVALKGRLESAPEDVLERLREMEQVLREALMGADRVRRIVRDLKTFSRQDEDARGPVDLRSVMDSAAKMAAGELRPRAQLARDYAEVPRAYGNEARLAQVFLNLIINAAQALPEGHAEQNEVRLVTRRVGSDEVAAEIHDTGSGIPAEVLGRIFDPFFTTKPVGVGTGLGLALCHAFVTAMGGRIEVESQVSRGTMFRVTLPVAPGEQVQVSRVEAAKEGESMRGRVLVVDDDPLVSSALRRTLSREHEVDVVVSSRRALEMLLSPQGMYDVILCDLMMPEMTGMELHAQLEAALPERAQRMVFVTGGAYTPAAMEFLERVSNPRLEKPFEPEKLRERVREWVALVHPPPPG
ncbi:two-component regulator propeller domain-containing protein [Hyalangium sp.]|uniref:two-component regulator propeller domain-containing protein n=1 Tax=Hyalangium sp. TaxID=2028555 RepID=UPI002D6480A7|nr:two-component regulator propeller domain-containing protein [Hyalangium sp.]HYH97746.1 two-component regulator propeller domain-containing protein [Hyalangium sp.]